MKTIIMGLLILGLMGMADNFNKISKMFSTNPADITAEADPSPLLQQAPTPTAKPTQAPLHNNYRDFLDPMLKEEEGYSNVTYGDHNGHPTVGHGINLDDKYNQGLLRFHGMDPESLAAGSSTIDESSLPKIHESILRNKESQVRDRIGSDLFDTLSPKEQATVMSLGYQSLDLIGPKIKQAIANMDTVGVGRELILNSNPKQMPGVLKRRLNEAQMYLDPIGFAQSFQSMSPEEKRTLTGIINSTKNESQKQELLIKYGPYLNTDMSPVEFPKLQRYITKK